MTESKSTRKLFGVLVRIDVCHGGPEEIQLNEHFVRVGLFQDQVEGCFSVDQLELGKMVVKGELDTRLVTRLGFCKNLCDKVGIRHTQVK